jgi:hypothetical protein
VIPYSKVVMIAIPPEAFDVVRSEPDMGFRVLQLAIASRSVDELTFIAEQTDIYGALLYAIAKAGKATVSYTELAAIIDRDFREPIAGQWIGASLGHMSTLADLNRGTGDAAVTYKNDDLHVLDPFLLYYLRHGSWSVEKPHMDDEPEQETLSVA